MKTPNTLSRRAALVWLWRNDPEARWFWLSAYLIGANLRHDVAINLRDYGARKQP